MKYRKLSSTAVNEISITNYQKTQVQIDNLEFDLDYKVTLTAVNINSNQISEEVTAMATILEKGEYFYYFLKVTLLVF